MLLKFYKLLSTALFFAIIISGLSYSNTNSIEGKITDKITGEPLTGANVFLLGTAFGSATDLNGDFEIKNIPTGEYRLRASYLGYKQQIQIINIEDEIKLSADFELETESIEGETVVVTTQALGQKQAINQQLSSKNIKNVVSSARIQEVPDANAVESVGRLPGVSILRDGGEGSKVVVRGLEPKFNAITINGVKLSSSGAGDRGADLSMISSTMLAGIEVSKSITPDMDANAIGGVVNFELRDAISNVAGEPKFSLNTKVGYNGLENAKDKFRNYKIDGTFENRMLDNKFGVFLQGSYENRNLSSNELGAEYTSLGNSEIDYLTRNIVLNDIWRIRERGNAVLSLDYKLTNGKIKLSNLFSTSNTEINNRGQFYNVERGANTQRFNANYSESKLNTISNILNFEHELSIFNVEATLSHSYSETKNPKDWSVVFTNTPAGIEEFGFASNLNPQDVVGAANNDLSNTLLQTVSTTNSFARERAIVGSLDFETQFNVSDYITSTIKFGGNYQHQKRSYDLNVTNGESFGFASGAQIIDQLQNELSWFQHNPGDNLNVPMDQFIDNDFDYGTFLDGDYQMIYPLNYKRLHEMVNYMHANQIQDNITYNHNVGSSITNDYEGTEDITAAYIMATINIGSKLTLIPGVRYQELRTEYTAAQGLQGPTSFAEYAHELKTVTTTHPYWLPDILLQYKPFDWFDVRLAYTNSLSYPDFAGLAPRINVAQSAGLITYNGFELKPIESTNYDAYFSFYTNTIGLFTVGAFLKQINDLIYQYRFIPSSPDELVEFYPDWVENKQPLPGIAVSKYLNNPYQVDNYGIELDWQTHFWYLPSVLSGLVLNINYTHIFSEAEYPYQQVKVEGRRTSYVDTSYIAPLLFQPDNILNVTIGYDYKNFSLRLSTLYSADIFTGPTQWKQLRSYTDAYTRWDLSLKQKLPFIMEGFEIFANYNNISGAMDASSITAVTGVPTRIQAYNSMVELGIRSQF